MIKVTMKNGFYYKGTIIQESEEFLLMDDITGKRVEIRKEDISVREELK